jgi:hypothetical protein
MSKKLRPPDSQWAILIRELRTAFVIGVLGPLVAGPIISAAVLYYLGMGVWQ